MSPSVEIIMVAVVVAVACALVGVFLVLRRMAMMSDAISHSILLGIVVTFFLVQSTTHPLVILGAAATGILTVFLLNCLLTPDLSKRIQQSGLSSRCYSRLRYC